MVCKKGLLGLSIMSYTENLALDKMQGSIESKFTSWPLVRHVHLWREYVHLSPVVRLCTPGCRDNPLTQFCIPVPVILCTPLVILCTPLVILCTPLVILCTPLVILCTPGMCPEKIECRAVVLR